jgi:HTH-type transcriptional regulator/antitoxin HigA
MNAPPAINVRKYTKLLDSVVPVAIQSEQEYGRMLAATEKLMLIPEAKMTAEQERLLSLLAILLEAYENEHHPVPKAPPSEMLAFLLAEKKLKPIALAEVLGSRGRVSEILAGKRTVSKAQARRLSEFFGVPADMFI